MTSGSHVASDPVVLSALQERHLHGHGECSAQMTSFEGSTSRNGRAGASQSFVSWFMQHEVGHCEMKCEGNGSHWATRVRHVRSRRLCRCSPPEPEPRATSHMDLPVSAIEEDACRVEGAPSRRRASSMYIHAFFTRNIPSCTNVLSFTGIHFVHIFRSPSTPHPALPPHPTMISTCSM